LSNFELQKERCKKYVSNKKLQQKALVIGVRGKPVICNAPLLYISTSEWVICTLFAVKIIFLQFLLLFLLKHYKNIFFHFLLFFHQKVRGKRCKNGEKINFYQQTVWGEPVFRSKYPTSPMGQKFWENMATGPETFFKGWEPLIKAIFSKLLELSKTVNGNGQVLL
jgi:hypothetical protein